MRSIAETRRVGLIADVPSVAAWREALQIEDAAEAMQTAGLRPETILELTEA